MKLRLNGLATHRLRPLGHSSRPVTSDPITGFSAAEHGRGWPPSEEAVVRIPTRSSRSRLAFVPGSTTDAARVHWEGLEPPRDWV